MELANAPAALSDQPCPCKLPRQGDTANGELRASDVGPVLRRFLTRAESFFDGRLSLTLCDELIRGQVPK